MKLTGKAKEDFEIWYNRTQKEQIKLVTLFYQMANESMQWGVYVDFFDSVEITIEDVVKFEPTMQGFKVRSYMVCINGRTQGRQFAKRSQSREYGILKACEVYNKYKYNNTD